MKAVSILVLLALVSSSASACFDPELKGIPDALNFLRKLEQSDVSFRDCTRKLDRAGVDFATMHASRKSIDDGGSVTYRIVLEGKDRQNNFQQLVIQYNKEQKVFVCGAVRNYSPKRCGG